MKFHAHPIDTFTWPNGAIGHRTGSSFDCLGPYAKVRNCPVEVNGQVIGQYACYATGYADTFYTVPAYTRVRGRRIVGCFMIENENIKLVGRFR